MAIKTILVPMSGLASSPAPFEAALTVAGRLGAHVEALHVAIDPRDSVAYVGEGMTSAMIEDVMASAEKEAEERRDRARTRFAEICAKTGVTQAERPADDGSVTANLSEIVGREVDYVASRGRLADLIVSCRPMDEEDISPSATLQAALMDTGRPVLVVPGGEAAADFGRTIAIGWNGSPESARAINAAMHFLKEADKVVVLEVEESGKYGPTAEEVVGYLGWHGVDAVSQDVEHSSGSVGERLLAAAAEAGADMVVMGAYTHSHLRRLIFGGVTGDVLRTASVPVLLAH